MDWRVAAALACVTLAASPGLTAPRHAPHAAAPAAQGAGSPPGGASAPASPAKSETGEAPANTTVSKAPTDRGGKAGDSKSWDGKSGDSKSAGPIDLTRPDDGYNHDNLRRRAARASLIAVQKKALGVPATTVVLHPSVPTAAERPRNAAGATMPAPPTMVGAAKSEPVHAEPGAATAFGTAKNSLGLSVTTVHAPAIHVATPPAPPKPAVPGINGTSLHQAGPGIGGPAKDHSAIAGSSYRHK
jgi:hypothetical protein